MFPKASRLELKNPPLELVICQVRFPTVLRLAANQVPDDFQGKIVKDYPLCRKSTQTHVSIHQGIGAVHRANVPFWAFQDKAENWTIALGETFLSLETKSYRSFSEFRERFQTVLRIAVENYPIQLRERLGLRYIDRVTKQRNPALPDGWKDLVPKAVIPLREACAPPMHEIGNLEARFAFNSHVLTIRSAFVEKGFPGVTADELVLDFDCYTEERADVATVEGLLNEYKETCYNAFRWALGGLFQYYEQAEGGS